MGSRLSFSNLPILNTAALLSVAAWVKAKGVTNVCAPIALDVSHSVWPIASADGSILPNMIRVEAYWRPPVAKDQTQSCRPQVQILALQYRIC
jgi:hypothetical protein